MPCRNDNSGFPSFPQAASFPEDFQPDTPHVYQAIAEHNFKRVEEGLPTQNYFQLSDDGRHQVLARSNELKLASRRVRLIPFKTTPPDAEKERAELLLQREEKFLGSLLRFIVLAGVLILLVSISHYL